MELITQTGLERTRACCWSSSLSSMSDQLPSHRDVPDPGRVRGADDSVAALGMLTLASADPLITHVALTSELAAPCNRDDVALTRLSPGRRHIVPVAEALRFGTGVAEGAYALTEVG